MDSAFLAGLAIGMITGQAFLLAGIRILMGGDRSGS
jgi:hypothetical protein